MRHERVYLTDIVEACNDLAEFVSGIEMRHFLNDKLRLSAVLQKLIVIGEAAARVSDSMKDLHPEVEWAAIAGLRNRVVHGYFSVEWEIVWIAATEEAPMLRKQIEDILNSET